MGLFSRKEAKSSRQTAHRPRPSVSSEAQAASLRVRARRRLAGAVALVLAAVIVLPMLLDGEPRPVPAGIEIAVPERNAPFNPNLSDPPAESATASEATSQAPGDAAATEPVGNVAVPTTDLTATANNAQASSQGAVSPDKPQASTEPKAAAQSKPEAASTAPAAAAARDQTAEAMAILEGRARPAEAATPAAASQTGSFVLQVASYGTDSDAKSRLDKLKSQGVSNAFIELATVNGKQTFRLRVGPFDSRAAAQAAQARLRTLGYDNGFITTK